VKDIAQGSFSASELSVAAALHLRDQRAASELMLLQLCMHGKLATQCTRHNRQTVNQRQAEPVLVEAYQYGNKSRGRRGARTAARPRGFVWPPRNSGLAELQRLRGGGTAMLDRLSFIVQHPAKSDIACIHQSLHAATLVVIVAVVKHKPASHEINISSCYLIVANHWNKCCSGRRKRGCQLHDRQFTACLLDDHNEILRQKLSVMVFNCELSTNQ